MVEGETVSVTFGFLSNISSISGFFFISLDVEVIPITASGATKLVHV